MTHTRALIAYTLAAMFCAGYCVAAINTPAPALAQPAPTTATASAQYIPDGYVLGTFFHYRGAMVPNSIRISPPDPLWESKLQDLVLSEMNAIDWTGKEAEWRAMQNMGSTQYRRIAIRYAAFLRNDPDPMPSVEVVP